LVRYPPKAAPEESVLSLPNLKAVVVFEKLVELVVEDKRVPFLKERSVVPDLETAK